MNDKKEKLLNDTYQKWIHTSLYDLPLDAINDFVDPKIMGYGTAVDEKVLSITDYRKLLNTQRKQAVGLDMSFEITPVFRSISNKEDSAIFVDEITVSIIVNKNKQGLFLRLTTILDYIDSKWIVVHWHGSIPTETTAESDTWLVNEWKRKNEELQKLVDEKTSELLNKNRELEIEASLEKVRTIAMGMRKPDDMLDVCKTISLQLHSLGVKEIRNVQTAIFYEQLGTYMNYEYYAKHDKTFITETSYTNHEMHKEFAAKMLRGKGETFITHIKGDDVKDWIDYQKTTNVFIDKYLETASSVNYYWFSLGPVALGISTYRPLTEEGINLFKRFVKVFELAYQRHLDIEKAEAQAREAKIETSLERVRARTMAMQKSEELNDVVMTLFGQMKDLGIDIDGININILIDDLTGFESWFTAPGYTKAVCLYTPYFNTPVMNDIFNAVKSKQDLLSKIYPKEEKDAYFSYLYEHTDYKNLPDERKKMILDAEGWCLSVGLANNIGISIHSYTDRTFSEKEHDILKRFAKVFEQTYTRFLDLKKAEAQAREAKIEAALERVRAVAMSMHKSDDIISICEVSFKEFQKLGFDNLRNAIIHIPNDEQKYFMDYDYSEFTGGAITKIKYGSHPIVDEYLEKIRIAEDAYFEVVINENQLAGWKDFRKESGQLDDPRLDDARALYYYLFSIGIGDIGISTFRPIEDSQIKILKRFRNVFDLAYRRYNDISLAEAQTREAQIESALEKIRSRSLAMQKSDELKEVITVVIMKLQELGMAMEGRVAGIYTFEDDSKDHIQWVASPQFTSTLSIHVPYFVHPIIDEFIEFHEKRGILNKIYSRELKDSAFRIMYQLPELRDNPESEKEWVFGAKDYSLSVAFEDYSAVGIASFPAKLFTENEIAILKRFAKVFEQAYIRFLDLQKAEAQVKEAHIEAALERVRSRTMGMQKSEELKEVIRVVYEQFVHLKISVDHAGFVVDYKPKGDWHFWIADEQDIPSKITHPYFESVWANQFNEAKEKGADFFATNLNFEEKNKFYNELLSHVNGLPEASKDFYLSCPGLAISTVLLENVSLYIENFSGIPYSDEENNTLMRFGKVFQQTYTRFLDLQRAEEQNRIIQADNDRKTKELEDARQLQLSMLPKELPQLPHLDIAVYMKTATEVGGDYYDFNVDADGTLTILVGDATGHGMMSGMMVSIMKSFFISNRNNIELKQFFEDANNSIKDMHLGRLMMATMGVQITSQKLIATNAGMPSLLYFRNKSQKAGEFVSHNFPLGAMKETKYLLKEINYEKGDTLLLMSDGFAELKNEKNEQYGYDRVKKEFLSVAQKNPDEIVEHLNDSASEWIIGVEPDDDVTFVVIKVK